MARYDDAGELNRKVTFQRFIGEGDIVGDYQYLDDSNWEDVGNPARQKVQAALPSSGPRGREELPAH